MSNKYKRQAQVQRVANKLNIGLHLAKELLIMAGGDEDLVINSSLESDGLDQCKARIIDGRFKSERRTTNDK